MSLIEFITNNLPLDYPPIIQGLALAIIWIIIYDFYHTIFNAIVSFFKKS